MNLERELPSPTTAVLRPRGRLTMGAATTLKTAIDGTVADGHHLLVIDLGETEFLDSSGLGALVGGLRVARAAGGDLRLARVGTQVRTVLELTTMDRVLTPYVTVDDAFAAG
ncbi:STAS domain-containing protein [Actinotalea sp. BY-33]|uniref:STAS domain-containing protein n=1 Tax=Actinotalea soli TaxID=2819234 RepID=A0A939LS35_9CELL|nr:STAS domain-containing protein [Actinotalea soli]MBO1753089.1 STAS domain-containing protein [Actinotalea soli]